MFGDLSMWELFPWLITKENYLFHSITSTGKLTLGCIFSGKLLTQWPKITILHSRYTWQHSLVCAKSANPTLEPTQSHGVIVEITQS